MAKPHQTLKIILQLNAIGLRIKDYFIGMICIFSSHLYFVKISV